MYPHIVSKKNKTITVFINGTPYVCEESDERYEKIIAAIESFAEEENEEEFVESISKETGAKLHYDKELSVMKLGDEMAPAYITNKIIEFKKEGHDATALENFVKRMVKNPSKGAIEELYEFLEYGNMPLTIDGYFLAFKVITKDYKDCYTKTFDNSIGATVTMDRNKVNPNRHETCSTGLHFCSRSYISHYRNSTDRLVIVKIDPADVVSIPNDYHNAKGRCCKYEVVAELGRGESSIDVFEKFKVFEHKKTGRGGLKVKKASSESRRTKKPSTDVPEGQKECNTCHNVLPLDSFPKDAKRKDGRKGRCKTCEAEARKAAKAKKGGSSKPTKPKAKTEEKAPETLPTGQKECNTCHNVKPISEFHKDKKAKDGHKGRCKTCSSAARKKK